MLTSCKNLTTLLERLQTLSQNGWHHPYSMPALWDFHANSRTGLIQVNPYEYFSQLISEYFLPMVKPEVENYLLPLSCNCPEPDWLNSSTIYSIDVRSATAWDHDCDGKTVHSTPSYTEYGTFLKTLCLIPHMKRMGLNLLYLLPIYQLSQSHYRIGDLGSIYSIKNLCELNPDLHDHILDLPLHPFDPVIEFKALIEACHIAGIRVTIDLPMRTIARDTDLLMDHPEWFYWMHLKKLSNFRVPKYGFLTDSEEPTPEMLAKVFPLQETTEHINCYSLSPDRLDPVGWANLVQEYRSNPTGHFLQMVEDRFQLTVSPAFSDWINDPQRCWDDITYYRFYLDEPTIRKQFVPEDTPPFLFFDSIKTNMYSGNMPNIEIWDYLSNVIPFYQQHFGIDGARIDMAHALPEPMEKMIIEKALKHDPDFKFISEELVTEYHAKAKKKGYHMIVGELWEKEPRLKPHSMIQLLSFLSTLSIPVMGCAETPDTPRASTRPGELAFSRMAAVLNFFLPKSIPFINCGFELLERQPMNLGLDATEQYRYMLDPADLYYGKLAFFDPFQIHWCNEESDDMLALISRSSDLRSRFWSLLNKADSFYIRGITSGTVVQFGYRNTEISLSCLLNLDRKLSRPIHGSGKLLISSAQQIAANKLQPYEFRVCQT